MAILTYGSFVLYKNGFIGDGGVFYVNYRFGETCETANSLLSLGFFIAEILNLAHYIRPTLIDRPRGTYVTTL